MMLYRCHSCELSRSAVQSYRNASMSHAASPYARFLLSYMGVTQAPRYLFCNVAISSFTALLTAPALAGQIHNARLILSSLQQSLRDLVLLDNVHMRTPAGERITVDSTQQRLRHSFEKVLRLEIGLPETFASTEELV